MTDADAESRKLGEAEAPDHGSTKQWPDNDWPNISEETLVEAAGYMGYRHFTNRYSQPDPVGFQAQAELLRRLAAELRDTRAALDALRDQSATSGSRMESYTKALIVLTIVLALLGLGAILATLLA
jgi:hypothetical protein